MTWSVKSFLDTGCIDERWGLHLNVDIMMIHLLTI